MNKVDSDVTLISSDGKRFATNQSLLSSTSSVFRDMFSIPSTSSSIGELELEVEETGEELEFLLPFFQPSPVKPFQLCLPACWKFIRLIDKYEVYRAAEAVEAAFLRKMVGITRPTLSFSVAAYIFASRFLLTTLENMAFDWIVGVEYPPSISAIKVETDLISEYMPISGDAFKLEKTITRRYTDLDDYRRVLELEFLQISPLPSSEPSTSLTRSFTCEDKGSTFLCGWVASNQVKSAAGLIEFAKGMQDRSFPGSCLSCRSKLLQKLFSLQSFLEGLEVGRGQEDWGKRLTSAL